MLIVDDTTKRLIKLLQIDGDAFMCLSYSLPSGKTPSVGSRDPPVA